MRTVASEPWLFDMQSHTKYNDKIIQGHLENHRVFQSCTTSGFQKKKKSQFPSSTYLLIFYYRPIQVTDYFYIKSSQGEHFQELERR